MYTEENTYGGWIGVDLDGTLALHQPSSTIDTIGPPIPKMLARVKVWLDKNVPVKIVTARVSSKQDPEFVAEQRIMIQRWCLKHLGQMLKVTAEKDFCMIALWDDRAVTVEANTGRLLTTSIPTE